MKKVRVKYIACDPKHKAYGQVHERFLIETKEDIQKAFDLHIVGILHLTPMKLRIANGDKLILNENGGWCPLSGTWEII